MSNNLREKLEKKEFVITMEIDPPKGANPWAVYEGIRSLVNMVDAVNIADSPMARMRMSPIALAHLVQQELKFEGIFHLTCRDRNLLGLQSELLGAFALGVKNILALTGDQPQMGDHPDATGVFDVTSIGLAEIANKLNNGYDIMGNRLDDNTDFFIGAVANPVSEDMGKELEKIGSKIAAGVKFFQTQPIFDIRQLERFQSAVSSYPVHVIYGLMPLKSVKLARYLNNNVPGVNVPDRIIDRLQLNGRDAGIEIARELLYDMKSVVSGVHIFPMGDISMVETILKE